MIQEKQYEFEVAFSFTQQDEALAFQINDLIQDRFKTFIYSEQQKMLVGRDGESVFNEVFSQKTRFVVVLFRETWGQTPWTRVEERAIRDRAHEEGYDFSIFVQLDKSAKMPQWLPRNRIYHDFERWGIKGLAPIIEARVQELGGLSRPESIEDQAARMKREIQLQRQRKVYLESGEGYNAAHREFQRLLDMLDQKAQALEDPEIQLHFGYDRHPGHLFAVKGENFRLAFSWDVRFRNSLTDAMLHVVLQRLQANGNPFERRVEQVISTSELSFDISMTPQNVGWQMQNGDREFYTSEQLCDFWLKYFLEMVRKAKIDRYNKKPAHLF